MTKGIPLRVFVATPGDLADERTVVQTTIDEHNGRQADDATRFEKVGWESVRGTAQRPQEAINDLVGECHFMIVMFRKSWGSAPGSPWGYTSGTEEELFTGLLQLGQDDRPMRDVWVVFLQGGTPDARVVHLQDELKGSHALMYETASHTADLKTKLGARLESWASNFGPKVSRHINLLPSSGKDLLRASTLRRDGEKLVELGQPEAGRGYLREAAVLGGPPERLAYAKSLEHAGELDAAQTEIEKAIDYFATELGTLQTPAAAEAFAALAGIFRRRGADLEAIGRLQQALTLLKANDAYSSSVRCRILDELGLAQQKIGELDKAGETFEAAHTERKDNRDEFGVCQSLVNLARLHVRKRDLNSARSHAESALSELNGFAPTALHANAEVLTAQVLLRMGLAEEALVHTSRAMAINQQIGYSRGEAISLLVSAQCHRAAGDLTQALDHAEKALAINEQIGDVKGAEQARWQIEQLPT
jgi:tetratricopeptide (TPR) repeat protein